jgi:hypothetical protein
LELLQRDASGFGNHRLNPQELQAHHPGKKGKHISGMECRHHLWKKSREQGGKDPVREAAQGLTFGTMAIRKYFGDETQMTAPWPIAWAAIKAKIQTGTVE